MYQNKSLRQKEVTLSLIQQITQLAIGTEDADVRLYHCKQHDLVEWMMSLHTFDASKDDLESPTESMELLEQAMMVLSEHHWRGYVLAHIKRIRGYVPLGTERLCFPHNRHRLECSRKHAYNATMQHRMYTLILQIHGQPDDRFTLDHVGVVCPLGTTHEYKIQLDGSYLDLECLASAENLRMMKLLSLYQHQWNANEFDPIWIDETAKFIRT